MTKTYFFAGQPIAQRVGGRPLTYLHADHLGSTVLTTGVTGNQKYHAYGATRSGLVKTEHQFTGHETDSTGLIYMQARYYDPVIGQFISPDTVVPDPTNVYAYNRYMYAYGNPLKLSDPSGHEPINADPDFYPCSYVYCEWNNFSMSWEVVQEPTGNFGRNLRSPEQLQQDSNAILLLLSFVEPGFIDGSQAVESYQSGDYLGATISAASLLPFGDILKLKKIGDVIEWSSKPVKTAANLLDSGEAIIHVATRAEAEELFLGLYQSKGYVNTTGMSAVEAKQLFGTKSGTYHWDDTLTSDGSLAGHTPSDPNGLYRHLQIHTPEGDIIRINFGKPLQ